MRYRGISSLLALIGAAALWACGNSAPTASSLEASVHFLQHRDLPITPLGLGGGVLEVRDACLYLGSDLIIWPASYALIGDDPLIITGDGWTIVRGDTISVSGGGYHELGELPSPIIGQPPPCGGPYLWVAETLTVEKGGQSP